MRDGTSHSADTPDATAALDVDAYLRRIGVDPDDVTEADLPTLRRLQRAHVTTVPFENLAIVGDPYGDREGAGVSLSLPDLVEKVVERGRGGYCFELNGLFHSLLAGLGYDVDRVAARVTGDSGARPPANHHANVVELDQRYVVDVGVGAPMLRGPLALDGTVHEDEVGVESRVVESDRPDAQYRTEYRTPSDDAWSTRYVFSDVPRPLCYFAATNDYLQSAPESSFTGDPTVAIATEDGHRKLSGETVTEWIDGEEREWEVSDGAWHRTLADEFGLDYAASDSASTSR